MTTKNNFDRSSSGVSISATVFYDTTLSQHMFDENFMILQHSGYRTHTIAFYIDHGNLPDSDSIEFTLQGTAEKKEAFLKREGYTNDDMPPPKDHDEYIFATYGETITLLNYEDFNKQYADDGLSVEPSKRIEWVEIRGYSQGDYARVAYCPNDCKKIWGKEPNKNDLRKIFTKIFYDAPVYASVTIAKDNNDESEYHYHDMPEHDEYEWKRDEFISWVSRESGVAAELLEPLISHYPSC